MGGKGEGGSARLGGWAGKGDRPDMVGMVGKAGKADKAGMVDKAGMAGKADDAALDTLVADDCWVRSATGPWDLKRGVGVDFLGREEEEGGVREAPEDEARADAAAGEAVRAEGGATEGAGRGAWEGEGPGAGREGCDETRWSEEGSREVNEGGRTPSPSLSLLPTLPDTPPVDWGLSLLLDMPLLPA